jgi:hypothetical protein
MEYFYLNDQRQNSSSLLCINFQIPFCKSRFENKNLKIQVDFAIYFLFTFCNVHFCKICGKKVLIDRFYFFIMATPQNYNDIYILKSNRATKF